MISQRAPITGDKRDIFSAKRATLSRCGRIMKASAAPEGTPWLWTLAYGQHEDRTPTRRLGANSLMAFRPAPKACAGPPSGRGHRCGGRRGSAAARLSADCPSGNAPTTRMRRLISRRMRSKRIVGADAPDGRPETSRGASPRRSHARPRPPRGSVSWAGRAELASEDFLPL